MEIGKKPIPLIVIIDLLWMICLNSEISGDRSISSTSDFSIVVKSDYYVDKTAFIADLLTDAYQTVQVISAPPRFGKSTVIDMVKRFFEKTTNENRLLNLTENYELFFGRRRLNISRRDNLVFDHFACHPVVRIDCRRLYEIDDYRSTLDAFRSIIAETFAQHRYLIDNRTLFSSNETLANFFVAHLNANNSNYNNHSLTADDMMRSFDWLTELLFANYGQPVVILIDDYDAHYRHVSIGNATDADRIVEFVQLTRGFLNNRNDRMYTGLMIGTVRRVSDWKTWYNDDKDFRDYRFSENHRFTSYFGLTDSEVEQLLSSKSNGTSPELLRNYYNGYMVPEKNIRLWNTGSIIRYLENGREKAEFYYRLPYRYNESTYKLVRILGSERMNLLGGGQEFRIERSNTSFVKADFDAFRQVKINFTIDARIVTNITKILFADLGFFARVGDDRFKMANEEMNATLSEMQRPPITVVTTSKESAFQKSARNRITT